MGNASHASPQAFARANQETLRPLRTAFLRLLFILCSLSAIGSARAEPGDELTVSLLTLSPGEHPFARFGHIEIWIHNSAAPPEDPVQRDPVYNFGNFTFDDPALIPKFLLGRFVYWVAKESLDVRLAYARRLERSMVAQELNLSAGQKHALLSALEENIQEKNRYYKYDYYRDNCATRVRDVIDRTIGGRLRQAALGPASMSRRAHTLRLTADDTVLTLALTSILAGFSDRPMDQWDEMFLAAYIQQVVRRVGVPGSNGTLHPLVKSERTLVDATRVVIERPAPPSWTIFMLLAGLLWGGALYGSARFAAGHVALRLSLALLLIMTGLLSVGGMFLIFMWGFTDHEACHRNENILQLMPLCVAQIWLCSGVARLQLRAVARARCLFAGAAVVSVLGLFWKVLPAMRQDNFWIIALCVPIWLGGTLGLAALEAALLGRQQTDSPDHTAGNS